MRSNSQAVYRPFMRIRLTAIHDSLRYTIHPWAYPHRPPLLVETYHPSLDIKKAPPVSR
jgi:hypothetical protein